MISEKKTTIIIICIGIIILATIGSLLLVHEKQNLQLNQTTEAFFPSESVAAITSSPSDDAPSEKPVPTISSENTSSKINLNTATKEELDSLNGIGPALAERIIKYRQNNPFKTIYDIKKISGIGDKIFEKLKDSITVTE